jgi:hypothetical protein
MEAETAELVDVTPHRLTYRSTLFGHSCWILYDFDNGHFAKGEYLLGEYDRENAETVLDYLRLKLSEKYGQGVNSTEMIQLGMVPGVRENSGGRDILFWTDTTTWTGIRLTLVPANDGAYEISLAYRSIMAGVAQMVKKPPENLL